MEKQREADIREADIREARWEREACLRVATDNENIGRHDVAAQLRAAAERWERRAAEAGA